MRLRLFLAFTLVALVSVISVVVLARLGAASEVHRFMFRGGNTGVDTLMTALEDYYRRQGSWQGVADYWQSLSPPGHRGAGSTGIGQGMGGMVAQRVRLADPQGILLVDTSNPTPSGRLTSAELERAIPLQADRQVVGYLLPEGGMSFSPMDSDALVSRITRAAMIAGLIAIGLSLLLSLLLSYRLLRPVQQLTRAARQMSKGDLSQRVAADGNDELAVLGKTFNQMADSLQRAEHSRRAMTADIAHELRNPLAVQLAHLEAMQDGVYPLTPENLEPIMEQNLLLNRLVEDLRTLALADSGQLNLVFEPSDLAVLLRRVAERFAPQAEANRVEIRLTLPQSPNGVPEVELDSGRMEQILGNLLSNALRHTPPGGVIRLDIKSTSRAILLTVHDSGAGIPPEALPHIFERFYRADQSRSRDEGGTGLGLAIARQLAAAHGATLRAANHPQGGAVFTLEIPLFRS